MCLVAQSCPTVYDLVDCSPPDSSVHGVLQARTLEWVTMPSSRGSSQPSDWTWTLVSPELQAGSFPCIAVISMYCEHFLPGFCSHLLPVHSSPLSNTVSLRSEVLDQYLHGASVHPPAKRVVPGSCLLGTAAVSQIPFETYCRRTFEHWCKHSNLFFFPSLGDWPSVSVSASHVFTACRRLAFSHPLVDFTMVISCPLFQSSSSWTWKYWKAENGASRRSTLWGQAHSALARLWVIWIHSSKNGAWHTGNAHQEVHSERIGVKCECLEKIARTWKQHLSLGGRTVLVFL